MLGTKEIILIAALPCFVTCLALFSVREIRAQVDGISELLFASVPGRAETSSTLSRELPVLVSDEFKRAESR